jgi:hypothetical protein
MKFLTQPRTGALRFRNKCISAFILIIEPSQSRACPWINGQIGNGCLNPTHAVVERSCSSPASCWIVRFNHSPTAFSTSSSVPHS